MAPVKRHGSDRHNALRAEPVGLALPEIA